MMDRDPIGFVYIAGPYGDHDGFLIIEERIQRARRSAARFAMRGVPYYSPHLNSAHFEAIVPEVPLSYWARQDSAFLPRAFAVYLLEGWEGSRGTLVEIETASRLEIPVYKPWEFELLVKEYEERFGAVGDQGAST